MNFITYKPEILLIDDSEEIGETLSLILKNLGYSTRYFSDPLEAVSYFETELNPVVLLDINLPGKNGLELLPLFKKINPKTQVVMITGDKDINAVMYCLANRASDFILKPFTVDIIEKTLERVLEYYNLLKERENYQESLERDVRFTSRIQRQIIFPSRLESNLYIDYFPVSSVSGNFYHYAKITEDKELILFGNVEGIGVASGFVALFTISLVKDIYNLGLSPCEILNHVNNELYYKLNVHTVTLFCIIRDKKTHTLVYSHGGTPDPILFSNSSPKPISLSSEDVHILGIQPNPGFKNIELKYELKDVLFLYNEGFIEINRSQIAEKYKALLEDLFTTFQKNHSDKFETMKLKLDQYVDNLRKSHLQRKDISFIFYMLQ